jgi:hypothetical protein
MARYPAFLGRSVEVQYRAGDILLPASGTFVADSGRSIFLEQHIEQRGQQKQFRWEIPYQCIVRIREKTDDAPAPAPGGSGTDAPATSASGAEKARQRVQEEEPPHQANAAKASGGAPGLHHLRLPPKAV